MKKALSVILCLCLMIGMFGMLSTPAGAQGYQGTIRLAIGQSQSVFDLGPTGLVGGTTGTWSLRGENAYRSVELSSTDTFGCTVKAVDWPGGTVTLEHTLRGTSMYDTMPMTIVNEWTIEIERPVFRLTFDANGGTVSQSSKGVPHSDSVGTLPTPSRSGYLFDGWFYERTGGGELHTYDTISKDTTVYAHWTLDKDYTVTFNANGGKVSPATRVVKNGRQVGSLPTPTRSGYYFDGWYTAASGGTKVDSSYLISKNTTLYAHWMLDVNYTVYFDANGGKVSPSSVSVKNGKEVGTLPTPTRTGYYFKGWYTTDSGDGKKISSTTVIKEETTFYARWESLSIKITLDPAGGALSQTVISAKAGEEIGELPEPEYEGFTFEGWYLSDVDEERIYSRHVFIESTTLYARWSGTYGDFSYSFGKKEATIIKYNADEEFVSIPSEINGRKVTVIGEKAFCKRTGGAYYSGRTYSYTINITIPDTVTTIRSSAFECCTSLKSIKIPDSVTYIGSFAFSECKNLYYAELGSGITTLNSGTFSGCKALYAIDIPQSVEEIANQVFYECENLSRAGIGKKVKKIGTQAFFGCSSLKSVTIPARVSEIGNKAFGYSSYYVEGRDYGYWNEYKTGISISGYSNTEAQAYAGRNSINFISLGDPPPIYTVSFNSNGGSVDTASVEVESKDSIGKLPAPSRSGYTFDGWFTAASGGIKITESYAVTKTQTVYAHWTMIKFTVTLNANGGSVTPASVSIQQGKAIGTLPTPTRTGYNFLGWYTSKTGGSKISSSQVVKRDMTVYAQWEINYYTITFDPVGGSVSQPVNSVPHGSQIGRLPRPTRTGYAFDGWYTAKTDGTLITASYTVTKNITLYAQWTKIIHKITLDPNGGKVSKTTVSIQEGKSYGTLPTPTRTGYTFEGWYTASSGGTKITAASTVTKPITLYARWSVTKFIITFDAAGGSVSPSSNAVLYGKTIGFLPTPTRKGYIFDGWFTYQIGGNEITTSYIPTSDMTVHAHWTMIKCTITFDPTGGELKNTVVDIPKGTNIGTLPAPTRTGYAFNGWYTGKTAGNKIGPSTLINSDTTLFAHWVYGARLLGDADGDSKVSILDATLIQIRLAGDRSKKFDKIAADVDADKTITILDVTYIQRFLAMLSYPAGIGEAVIE